MEWVGECGWSTGCADGGALRINNLMKRKTGNPFLFILRGSCQIFLVTHIISFWADRDSSAHLVFHRIFPMCQYMRAGSAHLSIYASVYLFLDFSDDFILSIFRSATSLNIKIVKFLTSVVVDRSMYGPNYSQAPTLVKYSCWSFHDVIQSASSHENYEVHAQIFSTLVELLFLPAICHCLSAYFTTRDITRISSWHVLFLSRHSSFDDLLISDNIARAWKFI